VAALGTAQTLAWASSYYLPAFAALWLLPVRCRSPVMARYRPGERGVDA
jgi:hypothetical protein